jgi:predicted DNA-binding protein YlxM (UPF0122 family)
VGNRGRLLSDDEISRIIDLLFSTDMSISDIAQRMGCSRSAIASINRKRCVRYYNGRRSVWAKAPDVPSAGTARKAV